MVSYVKYPYVAMWFACMLRTCLSILYSLSIVVRCVLHFYPLVENSLFIE